MTIKFRTSLITQSAENRRKECHRFWLRLHHVVILIPNDRTSASKKINGMALIRTLTVSTTALERTKAKFDGFRQTVWFIVYILKRAFFIILLNLEENFPVSMAHRQIFLILIFYRDILPDWRDLRSGSCKLKSVLKGHVHFCFLSQ